MTGSHGVYTEFTQGMLPSGEDFNDAGRLPPKRVKCCMGGITKFVCGNWEPVNPTFDV